MTIVSPAAAKSPAATKSADTHLDARWIAAAGAAAISLTAVFTKLADTSPATVVFFR